MDIKSLNVLAGHLSVKVRGLVEEWTELHQHELPVMWDTKDFHIITPLCEVIK